MSEKAFIEYPNRGSFERVMEEEEERVRCWAQLSKDVSLSGIKGFNESPPPNLIAMVKNLESFIIEVKSSKPDWDNLNYRIDLPISLPIDDMEIQEYCRLILLRSYQKVWLRARFSKPPEHRNELD